jgi:hypothetical protein
MVDLPIVGAGLGFGRTLALVLLSSGLFGCEGAEPATSTEIFCGGMCERAYQCGGWPDVQTCERECLADPRGLEDFRPDFIERFASCFQRLSCSLFFTEDSFDPCWDEVRADFEPNQDTRAFCTERSRTWFECGYWYFVDECEQDWAPNAKVSLDRVAGCHDSAACDSLGSCTKAAVEAGR